MKYDVVIIGAGLGGLLCGAILSMEGKSVCIVEKNEQIGGNLQTFRREGVTFDTGVHYIGGLDDGQNLYQIFNYLSILDRLELQRMNEDGYDEIIFKNDPISYHHAMGYENFSERLSSLFPEERKNIHNYCELIKKTCQSFNLYQLNPNPQIDDIDLLSLSAQAVIAGITRDLKLRAVLAGSLMLYAGHGDKTPWYSHALIVNSYVSSAYRCTKGGDQIAKLLAKKIKANGGIILTKVAVQKLNEINGNIDHAVLANGEIIEGSKFISNLHPVATLAMTNSATLKPAYRNRIKGLENTTGMFTLHLAFKPQSQRYTNRNYYYFNNSDVWQAINHPIGGKPNTYGLFEAVPIDNNYTESMSVLSYMHWQEVSKWEDTANTNLDENDRGTDYQQFKKEKAQILLELIAERFPTLVDNISHCYSATPLSYRDYTGSPQGSIYGIEKDSHNPLKTIISPQTKIPNLYLTGQNLKLHGVLGVSISSLVTCGSILGTKYLIDKIKNANH